MLRAKSAYWVLLVLVSVTSAQDTKLLIPYVPDDANAIAVIRAQELKASPLGVKQNWAAQQESNFLSGATTIPPWVNVLMRASHLRPGSRGGDWSVFLTPLPEGHSMEEVAKRQGSEIEMIENQHVVWSPRYEGYFVEFHSSDTERVLAGMTPATHQDTARWIQDSLKETFRTQLSSYLRDAAADESSQITMAIDLEHFFDPTVIRYRLDGSAILDDNRSAKAVLTLDFQSLAGLTFAINVQEEMQASLRLDFKRTLGDEAKFVKPLVVEFFNDVGAAIDELESATVQTDAKSVTLKMPFSEESLRRILSLITTPPPPHHRSTEVAETKPQEPEKPTGPTLEASKKYFESVNRNIDDLAQAYGRAKSYGRTAQWHLNFAKRIEQLPLDNVDPELVDYGSVISNYLRGLGESLRGTAVKVNAMDRSVVYNVERRPAYRSGLEWWWGAPRTIYGPYTYGQPMDVKVTSNLKEVREKQAQIVEASASDRSKIWEMIDNERTEMRRRMATKYGSEFLD